MHLSAVEHKDSIVFLHAVQAGPASQSYGLQVAQLAGVPQPVIKAARKHLARLESQALDTHAAARPVRAAVRGAGRRGGRRGASAGSRRCSTRWTAIDPDALTPREALEQLYQLKRLAAQ